MFQMKASKAVLPVGIALLLLAPLVALTPIFTPPPNGCPCPQGFNVTTPFTDVAIVVEILGLLLIVYGSAKRLFPAIASSGPSNNKATMAIAVSGSSAVVIGLVLSQIDLTGQGWSIALYSAQGFYLETLGVGILLFAGLVITTGSRVGSLFLSVGGVLSGLSLLLISLSSSDFSLRCSLDLGCSPTLAASTVSEMITFGYVLAVGAFLLGLGLSVSLLERSREGKIESD